MQRRSSLLLPYLSSAFAFVCVAGLVGVFGRPGPVLAGGYGGVPAAGVRVASLRGAELTAPLAFAAGSGWPAGVAGAQGSTTHRQTHRGSAIAGAKPESSRSDHASASRARMAAIAYLDIARELADARAGRFAYRSTTPPPLRRLDIDLAGIIDAGECGCTREPGTAAPPAIGFAASSDRAGAAIMDALHVRSMRRFGQRWDHDEERTA